MQLNDNYGLYGVLKQYFFHKFEAAEYAVKTNSSISFHWDDAFWSAQDWKIPSRVSLDDLYARRARQLRDKYDYLILCYSGGPDSWNVLNTFDRNNIDLDEIVSFHDYGFTMDIASVMSNEVHKTAIPNTKKYIEKHPNTIHTLIDSKPVLIDYYSNNNIDKSMESYFGHPITFSYPLRRGYWMVSEPRFKRLLSSGKRVGVIWGHDKTLPRTNPDGTHFFTFTDNYIYTKRKALYHKDFGVNDEFFYWTTDFPQIVIKQCHSIIEAMELYKQRKPFTFKGEEQGTIVYEKSSRIDADWYNEILYSGWDRNTIVLRKDKIMHKFVSTNDLFISSKMTEDIVKEWFKIYKQGTPYYKKLFGKDNISALVTTKEYFLT